jgi:uncharacterized protein (DUF2236 family)
VPGALLSRDDLERLRCACGARNVDPRGIFPPRSVTRRVNGEAVLLLGGGRALLLQVAHPLVAAGVAAHSRFRTAPLERLWRTLDLMLTLVFADAGEAMRAVREIERVHARVHGVLDADVGPFPRGTPYDATDATLLLWVWATLVDTALVTYERFVAPLGGAARAAYYRQSRIAARLLGIPDDLVPATLAGFGAYVDGMIRGDALAVGPASREIAASIARPPLPLGLGRAFGAAQLFTVGLLPPILRARYGFRWTSGHETVLGAVAAVTRRALPFLPARIRLVPHARRAA